MSKIEEHTNELLKLIEILKKFENFRVIGDKIHIINEGAGKASK